jgi:general secretion pathway protein D
MYQLLGNDFSVTLRAIAQAGKLEILSRPSILARNSQQASILVGQQVPLVTNVRYDTLGNQINTVTYQDVGIILRVTPFITSDGQVEMIVSPEISTLTDQTIPISQGVGAPVIAKRSADTVVVTPHGQTVIIGGMMQNTTASTDNKIPLLGDIPGLGRLFKRKIKDGSKTELLIFLTPYIATYTRDLTAMTHDERKQLELAPKSFNEQELNKFLDGLPAKDPIAPPEKGASDKR